MKIYSEQLNKLFDTVEACQKAEQEAAEAAKQERIRKERELALAKEKKEKENAERKAMAAEVTEAMKALRDAQKVYNEKLEAFCKKYGVFHYSTDGKDTVTPLFDIFNPIFKSFL